MKTQILSTAMLLLAFGSFSFACANEVDSGELLPHELQGESQDPLRNCVKSKSPKCADAAAPDSGDTTADAAPPPPSETDSGTTPPPPQPVTCTSFTYSAWGACQPNGTQTRTVTSSSPAGCTGGTPVTTQSCTYTALDGKALYTQYCSNCHGTSKQTSTASAIQTAINQNKGGMGSLSFLTAAQIAAIDAAY